MVRSIISFIVNSPLWLLVLSLTSVSRTQYIMEGNTEIVPLATKARRAFYTELLDDHIVKRRYKDEARLVDMMFLTDLMNATELQDTAIFGFVLDVRSPNAGPDTSVKVRQGSYLGSNGQNGQNKRSKIFAPSYNKYIVVADLMNPPKVAVLIPRTISQSVDILLKLTEHKAIVGEAFYIYEPSVTTTTMGKALTPVLNTDDSPHAMIPLRGPTPVPYLQSTESTMALPSRPGETNYFVLTNKICSVARFTLSTDVSCVGTECDRQKGKGGCTCLHATGNTALVYEFDVTFHDFRSTDVSFLGRKDIFLVPKFKSLKATKLFFYNFNRFCDTTTVTEQEDMVQTIRQQVNCLMKFVNDNGGWTAVGWFMLGQISDASEDTTDKIDNPTVTPHLTYLHPSNETLVHTNSFKELQIGFPAPIDLTGTAAPNAARRPLPDSTNPMNQKPAAVAPPARRGSSHRSAI